MAENRNASAQSVKLATFDGDRDVGHGRGLAGIVGGPCDMRRPERSTRLVRQCADAGRGGGRIGEGSEMTQLRVFLQASLP